ncbi:MAG: hypothetical protein ACPGVX_04500 [Thalassobaculaceae bacterium]
MAPRCLAIILMAWSVGGCSPFALTAGVTAGVTAASIYTTDETPVGHVADFLGPSCNRVSLYDSPVRCRR